MFARVILFLLITTGVSAWSQVEPSATGGTALTDDSQMMTPPPVSGLPYASTTGSETRTNYFATTLTVTPAYIDNVLPSVTATPVSDTTYSILPSLAFNHTTPREREQFVYSPSFTLYEPSSQLDSIDQSAGVSLQFRLGPMVSIILEDDFLRTSNVFNASYPFSSAITGSMQTPTQTVIAPFEEQLTNTSNGVVSYQFARDAMIGGGGTFSLTEFPNPANAGNLYNSHEAGGVVFYVRRLSRSQYLGLAYEYSRTLAYPPNATNETQTHTLLPFYTHYFNRVFSFSVSAGLQRVDSSESPSTTTYSSWSPSVDASLGWQSSRGDFAVSYVHTVTSGGGLPGAFNTGSITASAGWRLARNWNAGLSAGYSTIKTTTPLISSTSQSGNTFSAQASLGHSIGEHFSANFGYQHLHENYSGITVISADPDSNREYVTLNYQFRRLLGR